MGNKASRGKGDSLSRRTSVSSTATSTSSVANPWSDSSSAASIHTYPIGTQLPKDFLPNSDSKSKSKPFHKWERDLLKTTFVDLASRSASGKTIDKETFLKFFCTVPGMLGERLFFVFNRSGSGALDYDEFMNGLASYSRGSMEQKVSFLFRMCNLSNSGRISRAELETMCNSFVFAAESVRRSTVAASVQQQQAAQNASNQFSAVGQPTRLTEHLQQMKNRAHSPSFQYSPHEAGVLARAIADSDSRDFTTGDDDNDGNSERPNMLESVSEVPSSSLDTSAPSNPNAAGFVPVQFGQTSQAVATSTAAATSSSSSNTIAATNGTIAPSIMGRQDSDALSPSQVESDWLHSTRVREMLDDAFDSNANTQPTSPNLKEKDNKENAGGSSSSPSSPAGHLTNGSVLHSLPASSSMNNGKEEASLSMYQFGRWLQNHPEIIHTMDAAFMSNFEGQNSAATASAAAAAAAAAAANSGANGNASQAQFQLIHPPNSGLNSISSNRNAANSVTTGIPSTTNLSHRNSLSERPDAIDPTIPTLRFSNFTVPSLITPLNPAANPNPNAQVVLSPYNGDRTTIDVGAVGVTGSGPTSMMSPVAIPNDGLSQTYLPMSSVSTKSEEKATWKNGPRLSISAAGGALLAPASTRAASNSLVGGRFASNTMPNPITTNAAANSGRFMTHHSSSFYPSNCPSLHCDSCGFELLLRYCGSCGGKLVLSSHQTQSTPNSAPVITGNERLNGASSFTSASPSDLCCSSCNTHVFSCGIPKFCLNCGLDLSIPSVNQVRTPSVAGKDSSAAAAAFPVPWNRAISHPSTQPLQRTVEGYLLKVGARLKNIMSRWYVLRDNFMYTYTKPTDIKPAHVLFLEGCFVEAVNHEDRSVRLKYGIEIILNEEPRKSRVVYASSAESRQQWLESIRVHANVHDIEEFYTIGAELGVGRFSSVREGISKTSGKKYAVKIIEKSEISEKEREALRTEVAVLKLVHHPSIIRLKNVFETRKQIFIVMTFVKGGDLFDRLLKRKRFNEPTVQTLMLQLIQVVQYLHVRGIVHRDLKPENLLLCNENEDTSIMLADFGLGAFALPDNSMKLPCGTLTFTAPEVLIGKGYGMEVDLWSIGVICYLLIRGQLPFDGKSTDDIREKIVHGRWTFDSHACWNEVSNECKDLIKGLLTLDPAQRLNCQQALDHPFFKLKLNPSGSVSAASGATSTVVGTSTPADSKTTTPSTSLTQPLAPNMIAQITAAVAASAAVPPRGPTASSVADPSSLPTSPSPASSESNLSSAPNSLSNSLVLAPPPPAAVISAGGSIFEGLSAIPSAISASKDDEPDVVRVRIKGPTPIEGSLQSTPARLENQLKTAVNTSPPHTFHHLATHSSVDGNHALSLESPSSALSPIAILQYPSPILASDVPVSSPSPSHPALVAPRSRFSRSDAANDRRSDDDEDESAADGDFFRSSKPRDDSRNHDHERESSNSQF